MAKRTIEEIYILIKQKKENAERDRETKREKARIEENDAEYGLLIMELEELDGEIDAYTDILCLIESSGVLDDNSNLWRKNGLYGQLNNEV